MQADVLTEMDVLAEIFYYDKFRNCKNISNYAGIKNINAKLLLHG